MATLQARWERILLVIGVVFYIVEFPHGIHGDASVRYQSLLSSLAMMHLQPMVYSYVHPIFSAPLILFGYLYKDGFWWVSRFNTFFFLLTVWAAARSSARWPGWGKDSARALALLLLGATMFPKHVTDYYAEVFSSCMVLLAILLFQAERRWLAVAALSLSVWNVVATIFGGGFLLLYFAFSSKRWRYLAALPLLPAGFLAENYFKYGEFYPSAYFGMQVGPHTMLPYAMGPGFSYPLFFGLLNVLFSFGRGIFFFAPGLVFLFYPPFWKGQGREREVIRAGALYLLGLILVYAKFWAWPGGAFWGPRYFLFSSVLAAYLLAAHRRESAGPVWRTTWIAATTLSCWVGCQSVLFGTDFLEDCFRQGHELEFICYYVPEYSVLWRTFIVSPPITGRRVAFLVFFLLVAGTLIHKPLKTLLRE
ncbi:MAG: hypothetical protein ACXVC4_20795, partial [Bdellovibrionota bacterium]